MSSYDFVVTGASGFIGSHLIETLLWERISDSILAIDVVSPKTLYDSARVDYKQFDLTDFGKYAGTFKKVGPDTTIIHLAANPSVPECEKNPTTTGKINVEVTDRLIKNFATSRFIFVSSVAAERAESEYGRQKSNAEFAVKRHRGNVLRLHNVYGPGGHGVINIFTRAAVKNEPIPLHEGAEGLFNFIHIDDVIYTLLHMAQGPKYGLYAVIGEPDEGHTPEHIAHTVLDVVKESTSQIELTKPKGKLTPPAPRVREFQVQPSIYIPHVGIEEGIKDVAAYERERIKNV